MNIYAYVDGRPIVQLDPSGEVAIADDLIIVGIIVVILVIYLNAVDACARQITRHQTYRRTFRLPKWTTDPPPLPKPECRHPDKCSAQSSFAAEPIARDFLDESCGGDTQYKVVECHMINYKPEKSCNPPRKGEVEHCTIADSSGNNLVNYQISVVCCNLCRREVDSRQCEGAHWSSLSDGDPPPGCTYLYTRLHLDHLHVLRRIFSYHVDFNVASECIARRQELGKSVRGCGILGRRSAPRICPPI